MEDTTEALLEDYATVSVGIAPFFEIKDSPNGLINYYTRAYCSKQEDVTNNLLYCRYYKNGSIIQFPAEKKTRFAITKTICSNCASIFNGHQITLYIYFDLYSEEDDETLTIDIKNEFVSVKDKIEKATENLPFYPYLIVSHIGQLNKNNVEFCPHYHAMIAVDDDEIKDGEDFKKAIMEMKKRLAHSWKNVSEVYFRD